MVKPILIAPHPKLRQTSVPVDPNNSDLLSLIRNLKDTLTASKIPGLGLSAPQIGVNKRVFIAALNIDQDPKISRKGRPRPFVKPQSLTSHLKVFVNPEIIWLSSESNLEAQNADNLYLEGCLSIPGIYALVKRSHQIKLRWSAYLPKKSSLQSQTLKTFECSFKGFDATLIQHEIDHLNGILFTDHVIKQGATIYEDKEGELYRLKSRRLKN